MRPAPGTASSATSINSTANIGLKGVKSRPTDINTLKYALIDSKSRVVTFVGKYDPTYPTGTIPYADILKDVLNNPYPSFSLEPTPGAQAEFESMQQLFASDVARFNDPNYCNQWVNRLISLLMNDPAVAADKNRFFKHFGDAFGMSSDEFMTLYNGAKNIGSVPQDQMFDMASKMMRMAGLPKLANALITIKTGGASGDPRRDICDQLGRAAEYDALKVRYNAGEISASKLAEGSMIICYSAMLREMEYPENQLDRMVQNIRSGSQSIDALSEAFGTQLNTFLSDHFGERIVNNLVLSPDLMMRLYNLPTPQSEMVFTNVPADSALGDILFRADYLLKTICTNPDLRAQVPAHLTDMEFHQQESIRNNYYLPASAGAGIGNRLIPADVTMKFSPDGSVVEFARAQVKACSWVSGYLGDGWTPTAKSYLDTVVPKYAAYLTQHYDDYAKVYPELYRLQEAAKVVALVRWAKANGYTLAVGATSDVKIPHPKTVNGFWNAVFQAQQGRYSLTIIEHGGASFAADEGEAWIKPQPDVTVTADVNKQLVASALLAEGAASAAINGDLEAARDLADKSARAMTGEIDLTQLPALAGVPVPSDPAAYAAADIELINQAADCLNTMNTAQQDLTRANNMGATPEADNIRNQALQAQSDAQAKLQEIMASVATLKQNPSQASAVVLTLQSHTATVQPIAGTTAVATPPVQTGTTAAAPTTDKPVDLVALRAKWLRDLDEVNRKIAITQQALLGLNKQVQANQALYADWEKLAGDGMAKCKSTILDLFLDSSIDMMSDRSGTLHKLADKLPATETIAKEKYRRMDSLVTMMKDARASGTFLEWLYRENKTDAELYEYFRDGIGQISSLLSLDKTVPGLAWKYGSMAADLAYTYAQYYQAWQGIKDSNDRSDVQLAQVKKLCEQMKALGDHAKELRKKLEETDWQQ